MNQANFSNEVNILTSLSFQQMIYNYMEKLSINQNYNCPHCHRFLHIKFQSPISFQLSCLNCKEFILKNEDILKFFDISPLNISLFKSIDTKSFEYNKMSFLKKQYLLNLDCLSKWKSMLTDKTINIMNEFKINVTIHCVNHNESLSTFYCNKCNLHLCKECSESKEHEDHFATEMIDLKQKTMNEELQHRIKLFPSIIQFQQNQNESSYNKVKALIEKKIHLVHVQSSFDQINNSIFEKVGKIYLVNLLNLTRVNYQMLVISACIDLYFHLNIAIMNILSKLNQYSIIVIKNLIELTKYEIKSPFNLNQYESYKDANIISLITAELEKHFLQSSIFYSANPNSKFDEETFNRLKQIKNVTMTDIQHEISRQYGKHVVKIKSMLIIDQQLVVIASSFHTIKVFDLSSMSCVMKFNAHKSSVNYLCLSNKQSFLSCGDDGLIIKWSYATSIPYQLNLIVRVAIKANNKIKLLQHTAAVIQCLNLNEEMDYFVSVSKDKNIIIWDNTCENGRDPFVLGKTKMNLDSNITAMCVIDTFKLLTITENKQLIQWRINSDYQFEKKVVEGIEFECSGVNSFKKLNDNLVVIGNEKGVDILDLNTFTIVGKIYEEGMLNIGAIVCLSATTILIGDMKNLYVVNIEYYGNNWNIKAKKDIKHTNKVSAIEVTSGNKRQIITCGFDSMLKVWNYSSINRKEIVAIEK